MRTDREIVKQAEALARRFAEEVMGYAFIGETPMREHKDPRMMLCWNLACCAIDELQQTDVRDAVANYSDEQADDERRMKEGATF